MARVRSSSACRRGHLRVEHVGRRRHPDPVTLADDPLGLRGGADLVRGGGDRGAARVELQRPLRGPRRSPGGRSRRRGRETPAPWRSGFSLLGAATSAVPQRPGKIDRDVPGRLPIPASRKDARVRPGVVVAGAERHLRTGRRARRFSAILGRHRPLLERAPLGPRLQGDRNQLRDAGAGRRVRRLRRHGQVFARFEPAGDLDSGQAPQDRLRRFRAAFAASIDNTF